MNLHHLQLFYHVAKYEGLTAASRRMQDPVQQPALSSQMQKFEEELGVSLFQRRPFALTPAGERLYDLIYPFFSKLNELEAELRMDPGTHLRMATGLTLMANHLPPLLEELRRREPRLRFTLRNARTDEFEELLLRREVDVAVGVLPERVHPSLLVENWLELDLALLVPDSCGARSLEELVRPHFAMEPTLVCLPRGEVLNDRFENWLEERGASWPLQVEVPTAELVADYVGRGFGYGLALRGPGRSLPTGVRELILEGGPMRFGVIRRKELPLVAEAFLVLARARAAELLD